MLVEQKSGTPLSGRLISTFQGFDHDTKFYNPQSPNLVRSSRGMNLEVHCYGLTTFIIESGIGIPGVRLWSIDEGYSDQIGYFQSDLDLSKDEVREGLKFGFDGMRLATATLGENGNLNIDYIIYQINQDARLYRLGFENLPYNVRELPAYRKENLVVKSFARRGGRVGLKSVLVWEHHHNRLGNNLESPSQD